MRIHLRKRLGQISKDKISKGKKRMISLYLAYQAPREKIKYEWLNLYLFDTPKANVEKEHNKETMQLAEAIRGKRLIELQSTSHGFVSGVKGKVDFLDYFKKMVDGKYDESKGNLGAWQGAYLHLKSYCKGASLTLDQIDDKFLQNFKEYLLNDVRKVDGVKLKINSAQSYFNKVRASLKKAFMTKMIKEDPCDRVKGIKAEETHRQHLTFEEVQKLVNTPCENVLLKKAFLFSILTGLRWSDVRSLSWENIKHSESNGYSLQFTQKKTKGSEVLPISEQAIALLGNRLLDGQEIFEGLMYNNWMNEQLQNWIDNAGITKKITFHCARHSFATLQLSFDTDIYTVSKLLGHRHLRTTEIYAKVIDRKKIEAANRIPNLL